MPRYEFSEGTSHKFWEIALAGKSFTTTYGKIGADGQSTTKSFKSEAEAKKEYDKLVAEKTKKGYALVGANAAPASRGLYFELVDGSSSKFWEIVLDGASFTTRYGKIGTDGQSTKKAFKSAGEAAAEHDKLVAEKTKKGYELKSGAAPAAPAAQHARDAKLEAAIEKEPDRADAYLVYADWLQSQSDLRGELIVLQHTGKKAAADKLLEQHAEHFLGKLADARDLLEPQEDWRKKQLRGSPTTWRWGYLEKIWIANNFKRSGMHDGALPEIAVSEALGWLLDHPSARFVREICVGICSYESNSYANVAKVIGKHALPTLRALYLGDFHSEDTELNWSDAGDISALYKSCPNLEVLTVRAGGMELGKIDLPNLRELRVITGGFDKASLKGVCAAKWPKLETLSLQLGQENDITVKDLAPIFDGRAFPHVKHLGLANSELADAICSALASSRIAQQLESLDLSQGTMGDGGATALAAGTYPKLAHLDVSENWITKAGLAALAGVAKKIDSPMQRSDEPTDPDDRYIAAFE